MTAHTDSASLEHILALLERADMLASASALDALLPQMLELLIEIAAAQAGTLYMVEATELVLSETSGALADRTLIGQRLPRDRGVLGATLVACRPLFVANIHADPRWDSALHEFEHPDACAVLSLPLLLQGAAVGLVQLLNPATAEARLLMILGNRMAAEIEKARLLKQARQREERMTALIDMIGLIGSTLDRQQLLTLIMDNARQLLGAEASSLFLVDDASGDLVLHLSTGPLHEKLQAVRVPQGQGIAGYVSTTGESVLVNDVRTDTRHYSTVDVESGFQTRSILAVPLRTRSISLGHERASWDEHLIGCIEAINKLDGAFSVEDQRLLQTLASQAATVLEIARLYADVNALFLDVIHALTAAIDAKDPYTEGHSQRVAEFAVAIANQLGCPQEFIHHLRIGAILHDVGKIGVSDVVLKKPGYLTELEFAEMRAHPMIGQRILGTIATLRQELPVITEHHERLDGSGYPLGLRGEAISLSGRITAVADAFDAMTSDRPYRSGLTSAEAFRRLRASAGSEFDASCVEALWTAYERGIVRTQKERSVTQPLAGLIDNRKHHGSS